MQELIVQNVGYIKILLIFVEIITLQYIIKNQFINAIVKITLLNI